MEDAKSLAVGPDGEPLRVMTQKQYNDLANLSRKVLSAYDALLLKHNVLLREHAEVQNTLREDSVKVKQLEEALGPVYDEYSGMKAKYNSERTLRLFAETHATKVVKDNQRIQRESRMLQRKSNMIMQQLTLKSVDIPSLDIPDSVEEPVEEEAADDTTQNLVVELNTSIGELQAKLADAEQAIARTESEKEELSNVIEELQVQVDVVKDTLEQREQDIAIMKMSTQNQTKQFKALKRASAMVYTDYEFMRERYEKAEVKLRLSSGAEIKEKADEEKISEANLSLQQQLDQVKSEKEAREQQLLNQIERLQKMMDEQDDVIPPNGLSKEEVEKLEEKVVNVTLEVGELQQVNKELEAKIAKMTKEFEMQSHIPIPPPPPPPPGPPAGISSTLKDLIRTSKQKKAQQIKKVVGSAADPNMHNAIKEMMDRINRKGTATLRAVPRDVVKDGDEEGKAMENMRGLLSSLKKVPAPRPSIRQSKPGMPTPAPRSSIKTDVQDYQNADQPQLRPIRKKPPVPIPQSRKSGETELQKKLAARLQRELNVVPEEQQ